MAPIEKDTAMDYIFSCVPTVNHVFMISRAGLPTGESALFMTMRLYGSISAFVKLGVNVPDAPVPLPIIFMADFTNHSIVQCSSAEFAERYMNSRMLLS